MIPSIRILPDPERGGYLLIVRGAVYWARSFHLALDLADCLR